MSSLTALSIARPRSLSKLLAVCASIERSAPPENRFSRRMSAGASRRRLENLEGYLIFMGILLTSLIGLGRLTAQRTALGFLSLRSFCFRFKGKERGSFLRIHLDASDPSGACEHGVTRRGNHVLARQQHYVGSHADSLKTLAIRH